MALPTPVNGQITDQFGQIHCRAATNGDHDIGIRLMELLDAPFHIFKLRIGFEAGKFLYASPDQQWFYFICRPRCGVSSFIHNSRAECRKVD